MENHQLPPQRQTGFIPPDTSYDPEDKPKTGISKKRLILVIVGIILLGATGFAAALLTSNDESTPTANEQQSAEQTPEPISTTTDIPATAATKTFKSDFPRVEFTYPETWKVTASRDDQDIRIESPEFKYTSVTGSTTDGNFRVYIRQGARVEDSKYIGRGIAAQDSGKLAYTAPAPSQRPETNLSFFGLDNSDHFAYFMIAGNFSLLKNESLGPEYGTEQDTYIIIGGYSSSELADDLATNPVPLEFFSTTNAYKQAIDIIESLKIL